ncbi:FecR domain-containing protein [Lunatibacter salilacus]|uniref:FecR domain-containing protein n=1 Tax=Lunatibacter salilacus TaxID=2483804 RepID=UPI00131D9244|nr:FecR domain-containing protein [Lunatibacter salilacus]
MSDDLLIKYLLRETTPEEIEAIQTWLKADPTNEKRYSELRWVWEKSKKINPSETPNIDHAWQRFKERRTSFQSSVTKSRLLWSSPWIKVAASIVLLVGFVWIFTFLLPHGGQAYFMSVKLESGDRVITERLLDGSWITLNKHTSLSYSQPLLSKQRSVDLIAGEAFFDVKPDSDRPFLVTVQDLSIRVLGTAFHVKTSPNQQEVILEKGSVEVSSGTEKLTLKPGEMALVDTNTNQLKRSRPGNDLYKYYVNNLFVAESIPLEDLVGALSEAYGEVILIRDKTLQTQPITTTLIFGSLDENLAVISETLNVEILRQGKQIIIE